MQHVQLKWTAGSADWRNERFTDQKQPTEGAPMTMLRSQIDGRNQAERRRHVRTPLQITLRALRMDPDGDSMETFTMTDISRGGIGAVSERTYYPGQRVVLNMPMPDAPQRQRVYATIIRCRHKRDGYHLGMSFDKPTASEAHIAAAVAA